MKYQMNLTIIFCAVAALAISGVAGGTILTALGQDATGLYGFLGITLTSVTGFGAVLYGQTKQNRTIETIKTQTNGTMTKLINLALPNITTVEDAQTVQEIAERISDSTGNLPVVNENEVES